MYESVFTELICHVNFTVQYRVISFFTHHPPSQLLWHLGTPEHPTFLNHGIKPGSF